MARLGNEVNFLGINLELRKEVPIPMSCLGESIHQVDPSLQELIQVIENASSLALTILAAWRLARVLAVKAEKPDLDPTTFSQRATGLEDRLDRLIDERRRFTDPDNKRFAKRLRKHHQTRSRLTKRVCTLT